jgi:Flp pilus assembly protein TadD
VAEVVRVTMLLEKYELALADYTQAILLEKENPELYDQRANCYIAKEDLTAALKDLDKAIDLAPNDPYYYNNIKSY